MRLVGGQRFDPGGLFNFKWSVADTDRILAWARAHWTASEIANAFTAEGRITKADEIMKICSDAGQTIRRGSRQ